ncbi:MAG: hypothetical protein LBR52_05160 [Prevotellaceae bacterium]|jgi:hypothetical protein|nr:hypothetical protein [Prevotellaceae bacterium]
MEELEYCEEEAIKFILNHLPAGMKKNVKNEDIEYVLDLIYDFYDEKGYLDEENDEEIDIVENEMIEYAVKRVANDDLSERLTEDVIAAILDAEYEYNKLIGVFEDQ